MAKGEAHDPESWASQFLKDISSGTIKSTTKAKDIATILWRQHSNSYDSKRAVQLPSEEAGHVVKRKRKSTETEYEYRKRRVAEIPSAEEIDDTNADDTAAITAMSIQNSLKYTMSLGKKELKEKLEENKDFVEILGQYDGREIYNTFNFGEHEADKLPVLLKKFEDYCIPKKNVTVIRHRFNTRVQNSSESIDQYLTDLKLIAKNCEFEHLKDGLIRDRIVCGTNSSRVKERLLREDGLTLDKAVGICRADEESRKQMKTLNEEEQVHALRRKTQHQRNNRNEGYAKIGPSRRDHEKRGSSFSCGKCGTTHEKRNCPAYGKKCHKCKKPNHYQKFCKSKFSKSVHGLDEYSSCESDGENYFVGAVNRKTEIKENACFTSFKLQGDKLKVIGKCSLYLKDKNCEFFVTDTNQSPLLGFKASNELGLIHVIMTVQADVDDPVKSFPKVFTGLGCLEKPYHIKIDSSVNPVINPPRKIPAALREKLKGTLKEMEDKEVIRKVDEPTDWVNSLVVVEKPKTGKLRICLDPRNLNKAIKREHFALPTIEDITTRLTGAKYLSKLDCNSGYWQLRMDKESQLLTTFNSPFGRYCFLRMPFGIKSAQEVFQKRVSQLFENLKGVETDIDDILVWGTTRKEHDDRLRSVLNRCQEVGLTLNAEKCKFRVKEVTYIGHTLSADGVRPDQEKIRAIKEMPAPTDKKRNTTTTRDN
ncbi:Hypothetical predicted protein [Mytilus galloprovincialis]|uniref:Reverse transcriptase domain-containing protein n=1 Tax=Mytilus galloprovincialis TaxID=29158 RepID=A0A8B6FBT2_MYTGA|nr:Hypothetical predicted protein [Mytilus galloprovincialis]